MNRLLRGLLAGFLAIGSLSLTSAPTLAGPASLLDLDACPSTHNKTTSGAVTGLSSGCWSSSGSAEFFAKGKLESKLGRISGVVCDICEDSGLQCSRSVTFGSPGISYTDVSSECDPGEHAATATYDGAYTVRCAVCDQSGEL